MDRRGFIGGAISSLLALLGIGTAEPTAGPVAIESSPALDRRELFPELPEWFKQIDCTRTMKPPSIHDPAFPGVATLFVTGRLKKPIG